MRRKAWYPDLAVNLRKHPPLVWEARLRLEGRDSIHFYGHTAEDVEQDLADAFELLGPERVKLIKSSQHRRTHVR